MGTLILVILNSILCAFLGRMGGSGNYPRQTRIIGIPFFCCLQAYLMGMHQIVPLIALFGLLVASVSTYWDFLLKEDNFFVHGFFIGLSLGSITYVTHQWWMLFIIIPVFTLWIGIWSEKVWNVVWEEAGRYWIIPIAIWLLLR